jgi:integrase/recombinase XerD
VSVADRNALPAAPPASPTRRREVVEQPPLFEVASDGHLTPGVAVMAALSPTTSLELARYWWRRALETNGHPPNTVESYSYDLSLFQTSIGPKPVNRITQRDVGEFLDQTRSRSTRKRRLTSLGSFFDFLVKKTKVLAADPSDGFFPDHIPLKTPNPLFDNEQEAMLAAATDDGPRSQVMVMLMLLLGISRGELLAIKRDHIDLSEPARPVVYVFYENPRWRGKERKLSAPPEFTPVYQAFLAEFEPTGLLFEMLPQSVNKLVERVGRAAQITKHVTPQLLRDTYAVNQARQGADENKLLALLGLADDPRNRTSVQRYLKLGAPAM